LFQLQTYTIYGQSGVGKTELALEYAYKNPTGFEAIFWVNCETRFALQQSFTDIAIAIGLPNAMQSDYHEENQLAVLAWLNETERHWLLIFNNVENASAIKGFWPLGANGAILITSRSQNNLLNVDKHVGDEIRPFNKHESFELLTNILGPDGTGQHEHWLTSRSEVGAAQEWLAQLDGLPLAIVQAAMLMKHESISGQSIQSTYECFLVSVGLSRGVPIQAPE
jgi:hypothetical protein